MDMSVFDQGIIVAVVAAVVIAGLLFTRLASRNLNAYFLGRRKIPWLLISLSNAVGMFEASGVILVAVTIFICGFRGLWIACLGGAAFQAFVIVYLALWIRRSGVLTGAEWMCTRFGDYFGGQLAQLITVIFAIASLLAFLGYAFAAAGKLGTALLPWNFTADQYGVMFIGIVTFYVVLGGFYGIVFADVVRFVLLVVTSVAIAVLTFSTTTPEAIIDKVPPGWTEMTFRRTLEMDWSQLIASVNNKIAAEDWSLLGILLMMLAFKGMFSGMAGPLGGRNMQRILATHTPGQSALMSCATPVLLNLPRFLFIGSIAILGLVFFSTPLESMGPDADFDNMLPFLLENHILTGLKGLVVAMLIAALMSTVDSTLNSATAYFVNDVCKRYIIPNASSRTYVAVAYISTIAIALLGIYLGFLGESIHQSCTWILAGLAGGYVAPNILKWHWWRFNGWGYSAGMVSGVGLALATPFIQQHIEVIEDVKPLHAFPVIFAISAACAIIVSILTPPDNEQVLKKFYSSVRPWGLWRPIHLKVLRLDRSFHLDSSPWRDLPNVVVAIVWQMAMMLAPLALIARQYKMAWAAMAIIVVASIFLKRNWLNRLPRH